MNIKSLGIFALKVLAVLVVYKLVVAPLLPASVKSYTPDV